jgi:hypothetical protein
MLGFRIVPQNTISIVNFPNKFFPKEMFPKVLVKKPRTTQYPEHHGGDTGIS